MDIYALVQAIVKNRKDTIIIIEDNLSKSLKNKLRKRGYYYDDIIKRYIGHKKPPKKIKFVKYTNSELFKILDYNFKFLPEEVSLSIKEKSAGGLCGIYLGAINRPIKVEANFLSCYRYTNRLGAVYIYKFKTLYSGSLVYWKTTFKLNLTSNIPYKINGIVKSHKMINGERVTCIKNATINPITY